MKEIKFSSAIEKIVKALDKGYGSDGLMDGLADQFISNEETDHTNHECVGVGYNLAELAKGKDVFSVDLGTVTYYFIGTEQEILKKVAQAIKDQE